MGIRFLGQCLLVGVLLFLTPALNGQTEIFREVFNEGSGATNGVDVYGNTWAASCPTCDDYYEVRTGALEQRDSDGPATFITSDMDISSCNSVTFSMNYSGGPWAGSGNFDGADECTMGSVCAGDTNDPTSMPCANCWDFTLVELVYNDGSRELVEIIGINSNDPIPSTVTYTTSCLGNSSSARIEIKSQTWEDTEITRYDNVILICNDAPNDVRIDQVPAGSPVFCVGDNVELEVNDAPGEDFQWFDPNGNQIGGNTNSISFSASGVFGLGTGNPQTFSVLTTDGVGCKSTDDWSIIVNPAPSINITIGDITVCEGDDLTLTEDAGDADMWNWEDPNGNTISGAGASPVVTYGNLTPARSGTYSLTITDSNNCTASSSIEVTVEPGGNYMLQDFTPLCENDGILTLSTTQDGVSGTWSGAIVTGNEIDPSAISAGTYNITFTPGGSGCAANMNTDITIASSPASVAPTSPLSTCGGTTAIFDLSQLDNEVNGGSGLMVLWYENANQTDPIADPSAHEAANSTVYAYVMENGCLSTQQQLDLLISPGPQIMMAPSISGCGSVTLNNITILNDSGNQAYYDMPGGMGNLIPVGTVMTSDTIVYAYDENGSCSDEQEIQVQVGSSTDAGPDTFIDTCFAGILDLQSIVSAGADPGSFYDQAGNPINNDSLFVSLLGISQIVLSYETEGDPPCPRDEAIYELTFRDANAAGPDASATICTGESIDIASLTVDNGAAGFFEFTDGTANPQAVITMQPGDSPFQLDFYYIVNSSSTCAADTALITLEGLEEKIEMIGGDVCSDFSIDVFGESYNNSRPQGMEMGTSASGCDSIVNIDLNFIPENRILLNPVLCTGQSISINGVVYDEANFTGTEVLVDANGCDSIVDIDLTFDTEIRTQLEVFVCNSRDTLVNGVNYSSMNTSGETLFMSTSGCDSIVEVTAMFNLSSSSSLTGTYCPGDIVFVEGLEFNILNPIGIVELGAINAFGCDSSVMVDLEFDMSFTREIRQSLCSDMVINVGGTTYGADNPSGIEMISGNGACDSVLLVDLDILRADTIMLRETFCSDTSIIVNGTTYDILRPVGEELLPGAAANGCNQYVQVDLSFQQGSSVDLTPTVCFGEEVVVNDVVYDVMNPSGTESLLAANGCDSIVNIQLQFSGLAVEATPMNPGCNDEAGGELEVEIDDPEGQLLDVVLDGVSVREDYLANDGLFTSLSPGDHELVVFSADGCSTITTFTIVTPAEETLSVSSVENDTYYSLGADFSGVIASVIWSPGDGLSCTDCSEPEARPAVNTTYFVDITDRNGCAFRDSVSLRFLVDAIIYKPNVFSPNEDGVNDIFFINSREPFQFSRFKIYDRWGNEVHSVLNGSTGDEAVGWDGFGYSSGVYSYFMILDFPDGPETIYGEVSLIR